MNAHDRDGEDWGRVIAANTLRRVIRERSERQAHRERARAAARLLAGRIGRLGVRRVVLFGSLAGEGGLVHERSDIDLAVDGLPSGIDGALGEILDESTGFHVDLVRWEDATPEFRKRIEEEGEVLFVAG